MTKYFHFYRRFFAEGETPEQTQKAAETAENAPVAQKDAEQTEPEKKYTDEDIDRIIASKFAKWEAKKDREIDEAKKLAEMNATQKAEYERDQLQKQLDALQAEKTRAEMGKTARTMLKGENIVVDDTLIDVLVAETAEDTSSNVKAFAKAFNSAVQDAVKEALKGNAPKKGEPSKLTKDDIMKVTNTAERQRLIQENIELFR